MHSLEASLEGLRDIQGVQGSFVLSNTGDVLARDLPSLFSPQTLNEAAPRVQRLWDTLSQLGDDDPSLAESKSECVLNFAEYQLTVRPLKSGKVAILADKSVSAPALRMAANLVIRQLNRRFEAGPNPAELAPPQPPASEAPTMRPPAPEPTPAPAEPPSRKSGKSFVYRGRRYEE